MMYQLIFWYDMHDFLLVGIRKNEMNIFFNRKKILASWYFSNQLNIVWGTFSKNEKKLFLVKTHNTLP